MRTDLQTYRSPASLETFTLTPVPRPPSNEEEEGEGLPLGHYLWVIRRRALPISAFIVATLFSTVIVTRRLTPLYEATTTIDVDRQMPAGIIGQEAAAQGGTSMDLDQYLATQVDLIQSDSVLRPVVHEFNLKENDPAYRASTDSPEAEAAPVRLTNLRVARSPSTYLLLVSYRSPNPKLASDVANAVARSYLNHTYRTRFESSREMTSFMTGQLEELKANMEESSLRLGKFERELNVINPEQKTSIVSESLRQLNADYNQARTDRIRREAANNAIHSGSLDAAYASSLGESLKKLTESLGEARQKFAQVKLRLGENNPEYKRAAAQVTELERELNDTRDGIGRRVEIEYRQALDREAMLKKSVLETKNEFDRLNARSFDYQSLKRDAEGDKTLYGELVRKIREAGINANFQNSTARIADPARPPVLPVFPRLKICLLVAFLGSTFLGMIAALVHDLLDNTLRNPEEIVHSLQTEVIGTLPSVRRWRSLQAGTKGRVGPLESPAETELIPIDGYGEALRSLRNSILLAHAGSPLRSILITSASPSEGKSTIAAHLAAAHAEQHHKTLLIDGDLRRPSAHSFFGIAPDTGLSTVLTSGTPWRDSLHRDETLPHLHVLAAGPANRRAADLIGQGLAEILREAEGEYDLVILDSPPLIGFPEPLQMAAAVDGVVIVARAGHTDRGALANVLSTLRRVHARTIGVVLSEVTKQMSGTYYYYGHYNRYYRPDSSKIAA